MDKLLIATRNQGKMKEVKEVLNGVNFEILSLNDIKKLDDFEVEENALSYEGNAIIKAIIYSKKSGFLTIADDSGLEIDALGGRPGIHSARYIEGTDEDRNKKILEELKEVEEKKRTSRYFCVSAVYNPKTEIVKTFRGIWEGRIADAPRGNKSFGYAPIFLCPEFDYKKTNAELDPWETVKINHRGRAFGQARGYIKNL
ncbi:MAG: RdgB/HAM1 family non-canonical purine NTP pyrophosphatase [bacterium]